MFFNFNANLPTTGMTGYNLLKKTRDSQEKSLENTSTIKRELTYFKEKISNITSADDLIDDSRILRVALEAYGLGDEFAKKAYIKNILKSDLTDTRSAANRVSDSRWKEFAQAFLKSDVSIPAPLQEDFSEKMAGRAYATELSSYLPKTAIDDMMKQADNFRTAMKNITTPEQLFANKQAFDFVKKSFGLSNSTASNADIKNYLTARNEFSLNNNGIPVVPDAWKTARKMLSFFDDTTLPVPEAKDKKPNTIKNIESLVEQHFKQALSEKTGYDAYQKKLTDFNDRMRTHQDVDSLIADPTAVAFLKQSYHIKTNDTAEQIKSYLTSQTENNIPSGWKAIRDELKFHETALTPAVTDMTNFKTALGNHMDIDSLLADTDTMNVLKKAYELQHDTATPTQIKTYLTSSDNTSVPDAWQDLRDGLGFHTGTAPADSQVIDDFASLYLRATGTRADLSAKISYATLSKITDKYTQNNVSYGDDLNKFSRLSKEADYFKTSMNLSSSNADVISDARILTFSLKLVGLDTKVVDSTKAFKVLNGTQALKNNPTDEKWRDFQQNFSFSIKNNLKTSEKGFADKIVSEFVDTQFMDSVGEKDNNMKLALYFDKRMNKIASNQNIDSVGWLSVLGEPPLMNVLRTALNLPDSFGKLDVDKQKEIYGLRMKKLVGTDKVSALTDPKIREKVIEKFMLRSSLSNTSSSNNILSLLQ